jgi:hypothetical protein
LAALKDVYDRLQQEESNARSRLASLPNEIANATLNRFGPDTRAAVLLTAANRLLVPVTTAVEEALGLLGTADGGPLPLDRSEALELLALGEVIARKAGYGRQLTVRSARAAGASWAEIGTALGTTRQSAWEGHRRWIDGQAAQHGKVGQIGFDDAEAEAARTLAGRPD